LNRTVPQSAYRAAVERAGSGERLVQAFTDESLHTGQSEPELAAALDALMQWIEKGVRPTPQSIAAGCERERGALEGRCSYHPEYSPKPYSTHAVLFARGQPLSGGRTRDAGGRDDGPGHDVEKPRRP
jgi:hypothetical protein